jgi:hypothetical protein
MMKCFHKFSTLTVFSVLYIRMNSYSAGALFLENGKTQPSLLYVFIPLLIGSFIDIFFTQIMGIQFCLLNNGEYTCKINDIQMPQWVRISVRCSLQLGLIMCTFLFLTNSFYSIVKPFNTSLFGLTGLIIFWFSQPDLFTDFRRLFNGSIFAIKYN